MTHQMINRMKYLLLTALVLAVTPVSADLNRALDQTIDEVAKEAAKRLKETAFTDVSTVAVLPLWGDCPDETKAYIVRTIQDQIIGGKYRVMERTDAAWDNLLSEIDWSDLREDIMNQATLQQFGRIVGCDAVVYGTVRECKTYAATNQAVTRLSLTMGVVETGEAKWSSGEIKRVKVMPPPLTPVTDVDPALARAVNGATQKAAESLQAQAPVLEGRNFVVFPFQGKDEDGYVRGVLHSQFTKLGAHPVHASIAEWQEYLVANSQNAQSVDAMRGFAKEGGHNAVLYGTVTERTVAGKKYKAVVRFTVTMVDTETGQSIWSPGEVTGEAWLDWRDIIGQAVSDPIAWVVIGLLVLLIIWTSFKKMLFKASRPR